MSSLFTALQNASHALGAFDRAIGVTQNNVNNASTPGYVRQRVNLQSLAFQTANGLLGGVKSSNPIGTRDLSAERGVWEQSQGLATAKQLASSMVGVERVFDISGNAGLPAALSQLFQSFSAWSVTPNSATARQLVLANAGNVASNFQQAAGSLSRSSNEAEQQIQTTVAQINSLSAQIQNYNVQRRKSDQPDAAAEANVHNVLEELSGLVNFQALYQEDGTITVLAGGQTPLVIGDHLYSLTTEVSQQATPPPTFPNGVPSVHIIDAQGQEATNLLTSGKLGGLLQFRNSILASLQGDGSQEGVLNTLAKGFADRVNDLLTSGVSDPGPPAVNGVPLFTYNAAGGAAQTLAVNPAATAQSLAAADPGPPASGNGTALRLAALANSADPADQINNQTFMQFFGAIAAQVGQFSLNAQRTSDQQEQMVASAKALRAELSGVSLDEEAIQLVQFQRSYQATARMVSVIDQLTTTVLNMMQ